MKSGSGPKQTFGPQADNESRKANAAMLPKELSFTSDSGRAKQAVSFAPTGYLLERLEDALAGA